jgi:hypothetical protein
MTCGTRASALLIAQGAHPKEIQERLGHSTIRLTFDRYGPSLDDRLRDGLQGMYEAARDPSVTRQAESPGERRVVGGKALSQGLLWSGRRDSKPRTPTLANPPEGSP